MDDIYKDSIIRKSANGYMPYSSESFISLKRRIWIRKSITHDYVIDLINKLMILDNDSNEEISLFICSGGGNINAGLMLIDTFQLLNSPIRTVAVGSVSSMASVIFACGTKGHREIFPSAQIMIHEPRIITQNNVMSVSNIIEEGEEMQKVKIIVNRILAEKTGKPIEIINEDTRRDKYFSAEEAIEYGLADKIVKEI